MGDEHVHDMAMVYGERHAISVDCPCGPDVERVTPRRSVVYHQPIERGDDRG